MAKLQSPPVATESTAVAAGSLDGQLQGQASDTEFVQLLDSLEVRVGLMAQMQQTRFQIQTAQAKAAEQGPGNVSSEQPQWQTQQQVLAPHQYFVAPAPAMTCAASTMPSDMSAATWSQKQRQVEELAASLQVARAELIGERQAARQKGTNQHEIEEKWEMERLSQENEELWDQILEQRECIGRLTSEVEELHAEFRSAGQQLGVPASGPGSSGSPASEVLQSHLQQLLLISREKEAEVWRQQAQLLHEQEVREQANQEWMAEREGLQMEVRDLLATLSSPQRSSQSLSPSVAGLETIRVPLTPQTPLTPVIDIGEPPLTAPFSRQICGANVTLSEDGYVATRTRGCRQSVLIGSEPLTRQALGYYYEVVIRETVEGWVGGLGVGVTRTSAEQLRRVPDKAWRMPNTFIVGYWGCVFLDGKERRTRWRADTVSVGSRVGVLVSADGSGDLRVFVDGTLVVAVEGALVAQMPRGVELFPVVDVFAATVAVALQPCSEPPPPPWGTCEAMLSAPGSPRGSLASLSRSLCSSTK